MQHISTKMFIRSREHVGVLALSQEASSLHWRACGMKTPREFILVNDIDGSGEHVEMKVTHTEMQAFENEVLYWEYRPVNSPYGCTITVWND